MDYKAIEDQYLGQVKLYTQLAGIWPKQKKLHKYCARLIIFLIMTICNAGQVARVVGHFSMNVLTNQLFFLMIGFGSYIKQYNYVLNEDKLKVLLDSIVYERMIKRPQEEIEIMDVYTRRAIIFSTVYIAVGRTCVTLFAILPTVPPILDIVSPLNVSRERITFFPVYYYVDTQEYYYQIMAVLILAFPASHFVYVAADTVMIHVVQHACALLAISGHRLKHAMDGADLIDEKFTDAMVNENYVKVTQAILAYKKAEEYMKKIELCHVYYFGICIIMITMALTASFVTVTILEIGISLVTYVVMLAGQLMHVWFITMMGQLTVDVNDDIFKNIYEAKWYNGSVKTQALYAFTLRKCLSPQKLTCARMFPLNLDIFVQILKTSFSYYTVLKTT